MTENQLRDICDAIDAHSEWLIVEEENTTAQQLMESWDGYIMRHMPCVLLRVTRSCDHYRRRRYIHVPHEQITKAIGSLNFSGKETFTPAEIEEIFVLATQGTVNLRLTRNLPLADDYLDY